MGLTGKVLGVRMEVGRDWDGLELELDEALCRTFGERKAMACFYRRTRGRGTLLRVRRRKIGAKPESTGRLFWAAA